MKLKIPGDVERPEEILDSYHAFKSKRAEKIGVLSDQSGDVKHSFARKILEERGELLVSESLPLWLTEDIEQKIEELPERIDQDSLESLEELLREEQEEFLEKAGEGYSHPMFGDLEEKDVVNALELNLLGIVEFAREKGIPLEKS